MSRPLWIAVRTSSLNAFDSSNETSTLPSRTSGVTLIACSGVDGAWSSATSMVADISIVLISRDRPRPYFSSASSLLRVEEVLQLGHELADVAEMAIHRRETDIG